MNPIAPLLRTPLTTTFRAVLGARQLLHRPALPASIQRRGFAVSAEDRRPTPTRARRHAICSGTSRRNYTPSRISSTTAPTEAKTRQGDEEHTMAEIKKVLTSEACPPAGPYSQAIAVGPQLYISGQIPADTSGNLIEGSIADKTKACCENIVAIVKAAGTDVSRIVKVNVFLTDMANFAEMNGVYEKYFAHKPARSCVAVKQLPKGVPVEIEAIAYVAESVKL